MLFEWDENKRALTRERHKLDLIGTERGDATRLISFRRARTGEERAYRARFG